MEESSDNINLNAEHSTVSFTEGTSSQSEVSVDFSEVETILSTSETISEDMPSSQDAFNPFLTSALSAIEICVEYKDGTKTFAPKMAHQVFGQEELITGYRNLKIQLLMTPSLFHTYLKVSFEEKNEDPVRGEIADSIQDNFKEWFPHMIHDEAKYIEEKEKDDMSKCFGTEFIRSTETDKTDKTVEIVITIGDSTDVELIEFHKRFQSLIVFYIDAASIIQFDDVNWTYFYIYKEMKDKDGRLIYIPIGFATVYYFSMSLRCRVAQLFILPNFQSCGYGTKLLGAIYRHARQDIRIEYLTVESPCEEFTVMRDKIDLELMMVFPQFGRLNVLKGYDQALEVVAKNVVKMCPSQVKHLYNIFYYYFSKDDPALLTRFIDYMKKEFHSQYKRKLRRLALQPHQQDRMARIKRVVRENYMLSRTINRDVNVFIKSISSQLEFLARRLA